MRLFPLALALLWPATAQQPAAEQSAWLPHVQRGFAAQSAERWNDAVAAYTAAVDSGAVPAEHQPSVASNLGLALQKVGRLDDALSWFDKVLRAHPSNADAHHNRGNVLYELQRHAEAADAFGRAVALVPTDAESLFNQGNALTKMGDHAAAAAAFASVLRLTPSDAQASYNYANALSADGKPADAISAYEATLRLSPRHAAAQTNLGLQLSAAGRYAEAASALAAAATLSPADASILVALGFARKSDPKATAGAAEAAFRAALAIDPTLSSAYSGLASVLKSTDPVAAADAFVAAGRGEEANLGAEAVTAWLDKLEEGVGVGAGVTAGAGAGVAAGAGAAETADVAVASGGADDAAARGGPGTGTGLGWPRLDGPGEPIIDETIADRPVYPELFERAPRCSSLPFGEVNTAGGGATMLRGGRPLLLRNATTSWGAQAWDDEYLYSAVGTEIVDMLVTPTPTHPTIDLVRDALVEPARVPVYVRDFLRLSGGRCPRGGGDEARAGASGGGEAGVDGGGKGGGKGDSGDRGGNGGTPPCLSSLVHFTAYIAQLNLLRLPPLLRDIYLPLVLPASRLAVANLWIGGALIKNGLHFDLYDNLLFQLRGTKRALLFPPSDAGVLYYGAAEVWRHRFDAAKGRMTNATEFDRVRHNVAKFNVFAPDVTSTHPQVSAATPVLCELHAGEALFIPRGWHHAVISTSPEERRNLAINLWYESSATDAAARLSSLAQMFQAEGCHGEGGAATQGGLAAKEEL